MNSTDILKSWCQKFINPRFNGIGVLFFLNFQERYFNKYMHTPKCEFVHHIVDI